MRLTRKLAAVALALGAVLAGNVTSAAAVTSGAQVAACTSANFGAHVVWLKFTKTDGSTFCVGGGTGTVTVSADITSWTGWSDTIASPAIEYYGFLHYTGTGTGTFRIGDWGSAAPIGALYRISQTLPCVALPPPYTSLCSYPLNQPSLHVDSVEIDGATSF